LPDIGKILISTFNRVDYELYIRHVVTYGPPFLPRAHAQGGKVIGLVVVVVVVVVIPKIGISRDLGTWANRKPNKSIGFGEKLASLCFKSKETVHERQNSAF
jgi:hypothetical protein